jgi:hypothetical protein
VLSTAAYLRLILTPLLTRLGIRAAIHQFLGSRPVLDPFDPQDWPADCCTVLAAAESW